MSEPMRVLVVDSFDNAGIIPLRQIAEVDVRPELTAAELPALIGPYHALIVGSDTHVDERLIEAAYNLRVIACTGSRLDQIDVSAARLMGIEVRSGDAGNTVAVAEQTMSLLLRLTTLGGLGNPFSLADRSVGLVGFGRVGRQVAKRARAFDMTILVNQPRLTPELALAAGVQVADLPDLLRQADFVSLHVPFNDETRHLISAHELALMPAGAFLVNTAHTDIVDCAAVMQALHSGHLAGAALTLPPDSSLSHPHLIPVQPIGRGSHDSRARDRDLARQITDVLHVQPPSDSLSLKIVPSDRVIPHEYTDDKRVARLMASLEAEGRLVNPPIVAEWSDQYIVLDGATRSTALKQLGFPYTVVQVASTDREGFALHTWYHAISSEAPFADLVDRLQKLPGLKLTPIAADQAHLTLQERDALCYFLNRDGAALLAEIEPGAARLSIMNAMVAAYTAWGNVERTLTTDLGRLLGQYPQMQALVVFPQFTPETVFAVASRGDLMPAGLTRFIIPGRILRLNLDLAELKKEESLAAKRSWFNQFLADKLARSRLRYYQEPVILLDE